MFSCNRLRGIAVAALLFAFPACGGDDDGMSADAGEDGTGGDGGTSDDDGTGDDDGSGGDAGADCPFEAELGTVSLATAKAEHRTQPPPEGQEPDPSRRALLLAGGMEGATESEFLVVEMWDGYGPFEDTQLAAGEFAIEGVNTSPDDCGVCVDLVATLGDQDETNDKRYFATGGSVVVTSTGTREGNEITGNFSGSMTGVTLAELDDTGVPLEGGCTTTIEAASWDVPIENGDT
jgi:hypothetical protein